MEGGIAISKNRKLKKVYYIQKKKGLETILLKIVSTKDLAEYYLEKYEKRYPHSVIDIGEVDFVELL